MTENKKLMIILIDSYNLNVQFGSNMEELAREL